MSHFCVVAFLLGGFAAGVFMPTAAVYAIMIGAVLALIVRLDGAALAMGFTFITSLCGNTLVNTPFGNLWGNDTLIMVGFVLLLTCTPMVALLFAGIQAVSRADREEE